MFPVLLFLTRYGSMALQASVAFWSVQGPAPGSPEEVVAEDELVAAAAALVLLGDGHEW